jgi:hypothetical protein
MAAYSFWAGSLISASAQTNIVIPVNQVWKYMAASDAGFCLTGTGWERTGYDDLAWPSGPGGFTGGESTPATLTSLEGLLNTTSLPAPVLGSGRPQYFRTHFTLLTTNNLSLILSNRIDDQAVFYINGVRIADYRHPDDPESCSPGGAGGDEATVWIVITLTSDQVGGIIQTGDNLIAASVHQSAATSSDMVFVCALSTSTNAAPPPVVGMPAIFVNGQFITNGASTNRGPAQVSMLTSFTNGTITYSLDGSDPRFSATLYEGPFTVRKSSQIRTLAYNSDFTKAAEGNLVNLVLLPVLSATTLGGGTVTVDPPEGPYFSDSTASVTATPEPGWTFLGWNGDLSGTNPIASVVVSGDRCVEAVFGSRLSTSVPVGSGAIAVEPLAALYPFGAQIKLTAIPQAGNYFGFWGNAASGTTAQLDFLMMDANSAIAAVFYALGAGQATVNVIPRGNGRVVLSPAHAYYPVGQRLTVTSVPETGQEFTGWSGAMTGATNPLALTVNQSLTLTANFTTKPLLSFSRCGNGEAQGALLGLAGALGDAYEIQVSSNLVQWSNWTTVTNTFGTTRFRDPSQASPRFYRATQPEF